jgi:excisionase family DNA binding protein
MRLVSVAEAAQQTGIGRSTLFRWIRLGYLTPHKKALDRKRYVDLDQLEELRRNPPVVE